MRLWVKRAVKAALINSVIWLTPPPVHLVAAVMPLVSGYCIGSTAALRWPTGWLAIGAVMGLTLGSVALAAGGITLLAARLLLKEMPPTSYVVVGLIVSGAIGLWTALAGSIGAMWGMRRSRSNRPAGRRHRGTSAPVACVFLLLLAACGRSAGDIPPPPAPMTSTPGAATSAPATPTSAPVKPAPTTSVAPTPAPPRTPTPTLVPPASSATPRPTATLTPPALRLTPVLTGLQQPLFLTHAGDGSGNVYIVEKQGRIKLAHDGVVRAHPFLDISSTVRSSGSEQGLLGLAFHPDYRRNGQLFVNYIDAGGNTVVARFTALGDKSAADPASGKTILSVDQPFANHNGGMLAFGPDGMLWIGMGDGGSGGDPRGNGQNRGALLGKLLRLDVDRGDPYAIPADNPFAGQPNARSEIWAVGLRNPWRFSFDRLTGDLYIGDVGQNSWEEVDFIPAGSPGGLNFGWNRMEGTHCHPPGRSCDPAGLVLPIIEYPTGNEGCSVTGGYVYRGKAMPAAAGVYYFTDYCSGTLWAASRDAAGAWRSTVAVASSGGNRGHSSLGEDEAGELYVTALGDGVVYRLTARSP